MNWLRTRENAAFAKGLMMGKAVGAKDERERIIKLLEANRSEKEKIVTMADELGETSAKWFYQDRVTDLNIYIALIKGEK